MSNTSELIVGLATFAKGSDLLELLNGTQGGASGWTDGRANDESEFAFNLSLKLSEADYAKVDKLERY